MISKTLVTILLSIILVFNVYGIYQREMHHQQFPMAFGLGYAIVASGSMEPTLSWGDLIIVQQKESYDLKDIVTFKQAAGNRPTTHRIVSMNEATIITQGDANNSSDAPIAKEQIFGQVILMIPLIGYLVRFANSPLGFLLILVLMFLVLHFSAKQNKE